ncbi:UNVERIFIED_CONTAM: hypothetical protein Sradi_3262800 [Sesamum radiatum]|uniref:Uncharacterized protein n=1 Tax=Sesamum radiatum TaxID=300843 RepID=A0AAW2R0M4_SESRA
MGLVTLTPSPPTTGGSSSSSSNPSQRPLSFSSLEEASHSTSAGPPYLCQRTHPLNGVILERNREDWPENTLAKAVNK